MSNEKEKEEPEVYRRPWQRPDFHYSQINKMLDHNDRPDVYWRNVYISQKSRCKWSKRSFEECMQLNNNRIEWCRVFRDYMEGYCMEDEVFFPPFLMLL